MTFWLVAAGLTVLVLALLTLPLLRKNRDGDIATEDYDMMVYKNQLKEIARERERGVLNGAEAEAAEAEISRRILAVDKVRRKDGKAVGAGRAVALAVVIAVLLPLGATAVYLNIGNPGMPDRPFAERDAERRLAQGGMPNIKKALENLQARLKENPDDLQGWAMLGRSLMTLQRFEEAADAYGKAAALDPKAGFQSAYGEALVYAADGTVTEKAQAAFKDALELAPGDPRAAFYLARGEYQAGNREKSLDMLITLAQSAPADAVWLPNVRDAALSVAEELDKDISDRLPEPAKVAATPKAAPMLSPEQIESMKDMNPEDRQQVIVSMVDGLAERMKGEPDNIQGWSRLARALVVLKRDQEALAAYDHILARQPDNVAMMLEKARAIRGFAGNVPTDESAELMARVVELDPNNMEALWFSAMARLRGGDRDGAKALFDRAMANLDPGASEYQELASQVEKLMAQ